MRLSFRTRYLVYILFIHAVLVGLTFLVLRQNKVYFIASEILTGFSFFVGLQLYRTFQQPSAFIASGIEAIKDKDFTVKFIPTGNEEVDELIQVYNLMIDQLRSERTRQAEQQFFLDKLIEAAPIALLVFDYDGRISSANTVAKKLLQLKPNELIGRTLAQLPHPLLQQLNDVPPDQPQIIKVPGVQTFRVLFGQFIDRGFSRQFLFLEELTSEIIETEKKAYGKVIRMMAHEVNNSIGAINSILTITEPDIPDPELRHAIRIAIERNERLNNFMRRFADVVRLPSPHLVQTDVSALLSDVMRLMQPQALARSVDLRSVIPDKAIYWMIDAPQFEQVLVNVLKNALEACVSKQSVEVILTTRQLLIRDNGQPISDSVSAQLFDPFFSTKATGQGIGLTLTREILLNHNFSFSLQTKPDGWTTFSISH